MPRIGRRPGPTTTRDDILDAARHLFGELGYEATTVRMVAQRASVDPALVVRAFGGKEALFRAAVDWPWDPDAQVAALLDGDRAGLARRVAALFVATWDDPVQRAPLLAILRSAAAHEEARRLLAEFVTTRVLRPIVDGVGADEAETRAALLGAQLVGFATIRHVLGIEPLVSMPRDELVDLLAGAIERVVDDPLAARSARR